MRQLSVADNEIGGIRLRGSHTGIDYGDLVSASVSRRYLNFQLPTVNESAVDLLAVQQHLMGRTKVRANHFNLGLCSLDNTGWGKLRNVRQKRSDNGRGMGCDSSGETMYPWIFHP